MDDDLVLNVTVHEQASSARVSNVKTGGRWTDRLKAKRISKRKNRSEKRVDDHPPAKRLRTDTSSIPSPTPTKASSSRPPQVISSLFTSNPKIDLPSGSAPKRSSVPSNAPLADASTFAGLGLHPLLATHLSSKMNVVKPTAIQNAVLRTLFHAGTSNAEHDIFIQSQTGSGKTLSFLLPILQDLLPLSSNSYIDRSIGTLAIIIAPTRELAKQIHDVLESLLKLRLRPQAETPDEPGERLTRWLVSGLVVGGSTRTHEKARVRKGLPILVSTPGRLLDHLQNTSSFNVGKCRWLILDEADRLMELGFEDTISGIIQSLDGRRRLAIQAVDEGKGNEVGGWDWGRRRRTILCSATIREDVQKLAGKTLACPIMIRASETDPPDYRLRIDAKHVMQPDSQQFTPPSQLAQKYVVVPLKLRLVALVALLRFLLSQTHQKQDTKIIIFMSCTDSVDFHWRLLGGTIMTGEYSEESSENDDENSKPAEHEPFDKLEVTSPLLPDTSIFRLHGSLPTAIRLASLRGFSRSGKQTRSSLLFCTSVASRGLDLPLVRAVVQYDLPTEGGTTEYVHRVGRTARVGKGGEAWSVVAPSEVGWVKWVEQGMQGNSLNEQKVVALSGESVENVLKAGFGGKGTEYEERATEVQLEFERWVLRRKENTALAKRAFLSHMRAYSTHPSNEKHIFHIRQLHIGHLAKAFALREAPKAVGSHGKAHPLEGLGRPSWTEEKGRRKGNSEDDHAGEAEKRMQEIVRAQGRLLKKRGVMMNTSSSEFQIVGGADLENLVGGH